MKTSDILHLLAHPNQLRAIIQWKVWHDPLHRRNLETEPLTLQRCFEFLDLTSRSFSAVIQELCPELCVSVTLFYLILRGLDTVEDDMTIPLEVKEPILRSFDNVLDQQGWSFDGNGPKEKDRQLLVEFACVIKEFSRLPESHRVIIKDITGKMGNGMADYANNAEHNVDGVNTVADYDLYCYYVAGLVGEGLTRLFVDTDKANKTLLDRPNLINAMGLFLQKTNIIRDYREDLDDGRRFWPKEIWTKHIDKYEDFPRPENEEAALNCISEMCLNSLGHADECLFYLAGIKDQSVFNFAAVPQVMAIATLALVFRNKDVYHKNVKIPKGEACELLLEVGNLRSTCAIFRKYLRIVHNKNTPKDPNFLNISIAIGKIEQFIESIFPTPVGPSAIAARKQIDATGETPEKAAETRKETFYLIAAVVATLFSISCIMLFLAWMLGARFDIAFQELRNGNFRPPEFARAGAGRGNLHGEL